MFSLLRQVSQSAGSRVVFLRECEALLGLLEGLPQKSAEFRRSGYRRVTLEVGASVFVGWPKGYPGHRWRAEDGGALAGLCLPSGHWLVRLWTPKRGAVRLAVERQFGGRVLRWDFRV